MLIGNTIVSAVAAASSALAREIRTNLYKPIACGTCVTVDATSQIQQEVAARSRKHWATSSGRNFLTVGERRMCD
jgi:hypothetical protein